MASPYRLLARSTGKRSGSERDLFGPFAFLWVLGVGRVVSAAIVGRFSGTLTAVALGVVIAAPIIYAIAAARRSRASK